MFFLKSLSLLPALWTLLLLVGVSDHHDWVEEAPELALPAGFQAEVLYSPTAHDRGTWVALATDGQGRLLASDQHGRLYRMPRPVPGVRLDSTDVEMLDVEIGHAQGLLWAFNSLYVVVNAREGIAGRTSGLYRVRDTDGDDTLDDVALLQAFEGAGEHGPHSIILGPDSTSLYLIAGNHTDVPAGFTSRLPMNWQTDRLFPSMPDPRGHAYDRAAPGGWVARTDSLGHRWEIIGVGFRNAYDVAFNPDGELFTFDSDMEWDLGMPWYRPIRVLHVTSGSEFGWRTGTGKWPAYYPDTLPAVVNVGQGSPTGVLAGADLAFPERYRSGLFVADWSFGTLYFVALTPDGASYRGHLEEFLSGVPLPITDVIAGPDGALYFATGGRDLDSYLYRVTYTGAPGAYPDRPFLSARALRQHLEQFHNRRDPAAVATVWPHLNHPDRFVRYAARIAVEHQPVDTWRARALAEPDPVRRTQALLALARQGDADGQAAAYDALLTLDLDALTEDQQLDVLRTLSVMMVRWGRPPAGVRQQIAEVLMPRLPTGSPRLNAELAEVLVFVEADGVVGKLLPLLEADANRDAVFISKAMTERSEQYGPTIAAMLENMPPVHQIHHAFQLAHVEQPWTADQRATYFAWLYEVLKRSGGESYKGFIDAIRQRALAHVPDEQQAVIAPYVGGDATTTVDLAALPQPEGPGRVWNVGEVRSRYNERTEDPTRAFDYAHGRRTYEASLCGVCHAMRGEGGNIGPDLTQVGTRFGTTDLVQAITNPSQAISDQYAATLLRLVDGGAVGGRIVREADGVLYVNVNPYDPNQITEVEAAAVASREVSPVSLMPGGLLNRLNEDEVVDLIAYLRAGGDPEHELYTGERDEAGSGR